MFQFDLAEIVASVVMGTKVFRKFGLNHSVPLFRLIRSPDRGGT